MVTIYCIGKIARLRQNLEEVGKRPNAYCTRTVVVVEIVPPVVSHARVNAVVVERASVYTVPSLLPLSTSVSLGPEIEQELVRTLVHESMVVFPVEIVEGFAIIAAVGFRSFTSSVSS